METSPIRIENAFAKENVQMIPNSLTMFFLVLQLFFGVDCGFKETLSEKPRRFLTRVSILTGFGAVVLLVLPLPNVYDKVWLSCNLLKFILHNLSLRTAKYTVYNFLSDLHKLGADTSNINSNWVGISIATYTVAAFICKSVPLVSCYWSISNSYCSANLGIFKSIFIYIADTISGVLMVVVYYLYCAMKDTKQRLEIEKNLLDFEERYVALIKCYDRIRPLYNRMFTIELAMNTPRLIMTSWYVLAFIKHDVAWFAYVNELMSGLHIVTQICAPAVIGGMVIDVVDDMKHILDDHMREKESAACRCGAASFALRSLRARRPLAPAWGVLPLDLRLVLALFNFATTYFIVLLQFTHLYD